MFKAVLIDLDGVIYQAGRPIPGAKETLNWLEAERIPYLFVTNTTSRPRSAVVARLKSMAIDVDDERILTPAVAVANWIRQHQAEPLALFIPAATQADLAQFKLLAAEAESGAKAVVVGDLAEGWSFSEMNRAFRLLMDDPDCVLVALGMTRYWRAETGLQLDVGAFVTALEFASGSVPQVFGKPAKAFFEQALSLLAVEARATLMIGDDIRGDVGGAQSAGLKAALVKTGKFQPADLCGDIVPDLILDSIAELPKCWPSDK